MKQSSHPSDERLIFDVGMCDGGDTAYYLWKGYNVIAIEADPVLCEKGSELFSEQINTGRLTILNVGISDSAGALTFYRSRIDPGRSTFVTPRQEEESHFEPTQVECVTLADVIARYCVPLYIKIDIEGHDELALSSLTPELIPKYISAELSHADGVLDRLKALGYTQYKLINQNFHTGSIEILDDEFVYRGMRKLGRTFPAFRTLVRALPHSWRPRIEWDSPFRPDAWDSKGTKYSGPFGEETHGKWYGFDEVKRTFDRVSASQRDLWWDVHARR